MSVIIKGMEMPKHCRNCKFSYFTHGISMKCLFISEACKIKGRLSNCPLVAVPTPHGRLIDADALLRVIEENSYRLRGATNSTENGMFLTGIRQAIDESPTIIEAEVSE